MKKNIWIALGIILITLVVGCKSTKEGTSGGDTITAKKGQEKVCYNEMLEAYGAWDTFVTKGEIAVEGFSSSFELRMIRNKAIQISLRPVLGMEVARMIITPEKVYIYEKLNKKTSSIDLSDIQEKLPFALSFSNIQSIFLGKPFILGNEDITANNFKDFDIELALPRWIMTPKQKNVGIAYTFSLEDRQLTHISGGKDPLSQPFECLYSDYNVVDGHMLPSTIRVTIKSGDMSLSAGIVYTSATFDTPTNVDDSPFKNYNEVYILDLIKSFIK